MRACEWMGALCGLVGLMQRVGVVVLRGNWVWNFGHCQCGHLAKWIAADEEQDCRLD